MTASETSLRRWALLLKRLRSELATQGGDGIPIPEPTAETKSDSRPLPADLIQRLVRGLLQWEASSHQAELAHQRLLASFVDLNELRVSTPDDIARALGDRYPLADERAMRLRAVLHDVFNREHAVRLDRLATIPKRDARVYLLSLEGCSEFGAAYAVLHGLGGHALPADERLTNLLIREDILPPDAGPASASSWMEHYVHADESMEIHRLLQAWSDRDGQPPRRERRPAGIEIAGAVREEEQARAKPPVDKSERTKGGGGKDPKPPRKNAAKSRPGSA